MYVYNLRDDIAYLKTPKSCETSCEYAGQSSKCSSSIGSMSKTAFSFLVQSYGHHTNSIFIVLYKNAFSCFLLWAILETKAIVIKSRTRVITVHSIGKSIPGFFFIVYSAVVIPIIIVVIVIIIFVITLESTLPSPW